MIDAIRQRVLKATGFSLPDAYLQLYAEGRLRFGTSREDWEANWTTIVATAPPALMCAPWFMAVEWNSIDKLITWKAPNDWKPNRFVSFAGNGYGDHWVWNPDVETERGTPVILCRHDEYSAEIIAASFSDFLYRILLEGFAAISYDSRDDLNVDDVGFKQYLDLNIETVAPYIPRAYTETLRKLLLNDFCDDQDEQCLSLLSMEDKQRIIERDLAVEGIGTTFNHKIRSEKVDTTAIAAARKRETAQRRLHAYLQATNDANNAFRNGDYQACRDLLAPFSDMLTPAQEKKLSLASRRFEGGDDEPAY
ncbi:MAG: SMI1/KNR4 family protein [Gemmatimonadota bacterium]|nr:SMI1/KNR4 family protein [Gemmatimonadota bacterium]